MHLGQCGWLPGSRPLETWTSHARGPLAMRWPALQAAKAPPTGNRAHNPHTSVTESRIYRGFEGVLLVGESLITSPEYPTVIDTVIGDILALTKLNSNACIFGDGSPIMMKFANTFGEVLVVGPVQQDLPLPFMYYMHGVEVSASLPVLALGFAKASADMEKSTSGFVFRQNGMEV
jgi:hypothetical protein